MSERVRDLQQRTVPAADLARRLAAATPAAAEGSDSTGWVRVVLGDDGLPTAMRVHAGWRRHLAPDDLGAAVTAANTDAIGRVMDRWSEALDDSGWDREPGDDVDPALPGVGTGPARDVNDLAEAAISALQRAHEPPPAPETAAGTDDGRHVTIHLGPGGLTACTVDPEWAGGQDGEAVTAALTEALRRARAETPRPPTADPGLDALAADTLAALAELTRRPDPEGDPR